MCRSLHGIVVLTGLLAFTWAGLPTTCAQSPLEKRIVVTGENPQARHRLNVLDQQVALLGMASDVGKFVAWSAPACPLRPIAALVLDDSAAEKWERVLEDYLKLLDEAGDALAAPAASRGGAAAHTTVSSNQVRHLVHRRIAALPPSILDIYRLRVDAQAKKLLEEGKDQRSPGPLRRLVEEFFCSRCTDQALDLLGDFAFEEGNFEDALAWWRLLVQSPGEVQRPPQADLRPDCLLFPDPQVDCARVRAKEILAYAFLDQLDRARQELAAFRTLHPLAKGALAGGEGLYATILEAWIERLAEHAPATNHEPWTTFAGNPARNRALAVCPSSRLWVGGPTWRVRLPDSHQPGDDPADAAPVARASRAALLAFHPLVFESQVLIADDRSVTSYHLLNGRELFRFVLKDAVPAAAWPEGSRAGRYTLTAWNKHVFARLGRQGLGPKTTEDRAGALTTMVCLDLAGPQPGALQWQIPATKPDNSPAFFEGAPLAVEGRVFSAVSWVVGQRTHTALACYDARTGQRRWWQEVCDTPEFEDHAEPRKRQHLLTLAGGRIYYCSHAGAVVALDMWSGQCLWATRYRGRGPSTEEAFPSPRELAPCLYACGRLYAAPLDTNRLFCLDAATGVLVWECAGIEVVHLLGVTRGRVYFTTPRGLQCLSADTGILQGGWMQPVEGRLPGLGRGLLAGSWLLWPTQDPKLPLRGVTLAEGNQERFAAEGDKAPLTRGTVEPEYLEPTMLCSILPGNMAFGQDCLVVAGVEELAAYVPQKHLSKEREEKLKKIRLSHPINLKPILEAKSKHLGRLDLPLQKTLETPCDQFQSLARPSKGLEGLVLGQRGEDLFCMDLIGNRLRWQRRVSGYPFHNEQTLWLGSCANVAVRADANCLVGLNLAEGNGKHLWTQLVPLQPTVSFHLHDNACKRLANPFPPDHFHCNNRFLFFMVDERLLMALDPLDGEYAWLFWAPGGQIRPLTDGGRFYPHYHAGDRFVLLQTTAGKWLALDSQTGKLVHEGPASRPWLHPPLALDSRRFVLSEEAGRVMLLDAFTGLVSWAYEPLGYTSLTGSPGQVIGDTNNLLALVPRNIGPEFVRLDPDKGTPLWSIPVLADDFDVQTAALDKDAVFFICQNTLQARSLRDGALLWKKRLPSTFPGWQAVRAGAALLVYPHEETRVPWMPIGPSPFTWPLVFQTFGKSERERAILVMDPKNGQWMQRLPLTEAPGPITVQVGDNCLVVGAGRRMTVFRPQP